MRAFKLFLIATALFMCTSVYAQDMEDADLDAMPVEHEVRAMSRHRCDSMRRIASVNESIERKVEFLAGLEDRLARAIKHRLIWAHPRQWRRVEQQIESMQSFIKDAVDWRDELAEELGHYELAITLRFPEYEKPELSPENCLRDFPQTPGLRSWRETKN